MKKESVKRERESIVLPTTETSVNPSYESIRLEVSYVKYGILHLDYVHGDQCFLKENDDTIGKINSLDYIIVNMRHVLLRIV